MARDLFEEAGIAPPRDLFAEAGIVADVAKEAEPQQKSITERMFAPYISAGRALNNLAGSVVEPVAQMATGFMAKPISEVMGGAATAYDALTGAGNGDAPTGFKNEIQQSLTYEPRTAGGKFVSQKILAPIGSVIEAGAEKIGEGAQYVTGSEDIARGVKEAALQGVGFLGVKGGTKAAGSIEASNMAKLAALKEQQSLAALTDSIRVRGKSIGLIAPAEGRIKEGLAKMGGADPYISIKNREIGTQAIAKDVGLGKGAIYDADISSRVGELTKDYANVQKALGKEVGISLDFKSGVNDMLSPMKAKFAQDPKAFSALSSSIELLEQQLKPIVDANGKMVKQNMSSSIVMDKIKQLRSDARKYAKDTTGDPAKTEIAKTNYELANLYEDLIEKSLGNKKALLEKFRDSRKQLSQINMIESALMDDGLIDLQKLASVVGRYKGNQKYVTGNIETVAKFANTFRDVTKPIVKSGLPTPTRWETVAAMGGMGGALSTGSPAPLIFAAPMIARGVAPSLGEAGLLQGSPASYNLSTLRQAAPYGAQAGLMGGAFSPYIEERK